MEKNETDNYNDKFWIVNNLNLMNYIEFVKYTARKYHKKGFEYGLRGYGSEDFENQAIMYMPEAARRFSFETGLQF